MIKPFVDAMSVSPSGGHALFDAEGDVPSVPPRDTFMTDVPSQSAGGSSASGKSPANSQESKSPEIDDFQPESEEDKEVDEPIIFKEVHLCVIQIKM